MLVEGCVKSTQVTANGQQVLLRVAGPGDIFGNMAALGDSLYPASAQATTDCVALAWRNEAIIVLMHRSHLIARNVAHFLAGRLSEFQDRYSELATERVESSSYFIAAIAAFQQDGGGWHADRSCADSAGTTLLKVLSDMRLAPRAVVLSFEVTGVA